MHYVSFILEMFAYFWDFPSWYTAHMASWSPKLSNGAVMTTMENQTCCGENLQFSFKTEGFQSTLFCWKNLQF
jgi:hypothetical protein